MTILCIDDDSEDREVFREAVNEKRSDVDFISADDGEQALNMLSRELTQLPDVIFLDINMPKMDGFKCLSLIKSSVQLRDIPIIVYSTTGNKAEIARVESMGAKFLLKHPDYRKLVEQVAEIINQI